MSSAFVCIIYLPSQLYSLMTRQTISKGSRDNIRGLTRDLKQRRKGWQCLDEDSVSIICHAQSKHSPC